jgi:hypothetical protein
VLLTTGLGLAALATAQTGTIQIGSGSSTVDYFPIFSCYGYNYAQQIVLASEMSAASAMLGDLTAVRWFHVTQDEPATTWNHWTVYIGQTTQSSFASSTSWIPTTEMVQVYSGTITPTIGTWMELPFDAPFTWDGTSNLVVAVHEDIPSYYCTASWKGYSTPENRGLLYFNDNINPDPTAPPMANYGPSNQLAQIQFVGGLGLLPAPGRCGHLQPHRLYHGHQLDRQHRRQLQLRGPYFRRPRLRCHGPLHLRATPPVAHLPSPSAAWTLIPHTPFT